MIDTQGACAQLPCTVEVVAATGGWDATVASTAQGPFTKLATGVTSELALRVTRPDASITVAPSVGTVSLVLTTSQGPRLFDYDLELATAGGTCSGPAPYTMSCQ
jgi:hypothetical protein